MVEPITGRRVENYADHNIDNIVTPIKVEVFDQLLRKNNYDEEKRKILVDGFQHGFDIGYQGPTDRRDLSHNIPLTVGDKFQLWEKMMKETKMGRFAGPFKQPPTKFFIQFPVGLVPKDKSKTRLIFHLSYKFGENRPAVNQCIPENLCKVKYRDLDHAIDTCLRLKEKLINVSCDLSFQAIFMGKTDVTSAFLLLLVKVEQRAWLTMAVDHPITGQRLFFLEKNVPFGASSSCALFQEFCNSLKHILEEVSGNFHQTTNYLDDFLIIHESEELCNRLVRCFINLCQTIGCPLAADKTVFAVKKLIFLGVILDGEFLVLSIPEDKRDKALHLVRVALAKKKLTVKEIQTLTGTLNFLGRALVPGRAFTRRMYPKLADKQDQAGKNRSLKYYHHINLDKEFLDDCRMWELFLRNSDSKILCRPFLDIRGPQSAEILNFYTDALGSVKTGGFGAFFAGNWIFGLWGQDFMSNCKPSIEFLELYALCLGIFAWQEKLANMRIIIFCDNKSVWDMVNSTSSRCEKCMILIRLLVLNGLYFNRKVFVKYVPTYLNTLSDALSRQNFKEFWKYAPANTCKYPDPLPQEIWPVQKIWGGMPY